MQKESSIIRETESVCPECFDRIKADIVEKEGKVYMEKRCAKHGFFNLLLSNHAQYYKELNEFYFSIMKQDFAQRDYIVHLTNRCNLNCPICLENANRKNSEDFSLARLKVFLKGRRNNKLDLMGAEPTMREDLPEIIKMVRDSGNIAALHTNGIKISDFNYLKALAEVGLDEVHLQFDGFDDGVYEKIRRSNLLEIKLKALGNLEKLNVATDLVVTIVRGVNEQEVPAILQFGVEHTFVKEIFFLGCRFLGKARGLPIENCLMPDEVIDIIEEKTEGKISRGQILEFQKLYFSLLAAFSVRKCFYIQHYIIMRKNSHYLPIHDTLNIEGIQKNLTKFREMKKRGSRCTLLYLAIFLMFKLIGLKGLSLLGESLAYGFPFLSGFNLAKLPRKTLLLGFISACDAYSLDYQIAKYCGKGVISQEFGIQDTGAIDNVMRERIAI